MEWKKKSFPSSKLGNGRQAKFQIFKNKKTNHTFSRYHWPKNVFHEVMWFLFQDVWGYTANTITNYADHPILKSKLKVFSMFIVKFGYKYGKYLIVVCI